VPVAGIFTDAALATEATNQAAGVTVYVKLAAGAAAMFRVGHQVLLRSSSDFRVDTNAKVLTKGGAGENSYLAARLLENSTGPLKSPSQNLSDVDTALRVGNINAEGATMPEALLNDPSKWNNYTQIFRTPLTLTRTALRTRLRTTNARKEAKREAAEIHSVEMEWAFLFGTASENAGANGKPERTTGGLRNAILQAASQNVADYRLESAAAYRGKTWLEAGRHWLNHRLKDIFLYGKSEKLCFCGNSALLGINELAEAYGQINLQVKAPAFGIKVAEWITPWGTLYLKTHPLFNQEATMQHALMIFEPENLVYRYIDDTLFKADDRMLKGGDAQQIDGIIEEYLTEAGLEFHHPLGWGYLQGVGADNLQS
jgi:hypothetical protein